MPQLGFHFVELAFNLGQLVWLAGERLGKEEWVLQGLFGTQTLGRVQGQHSLKKIDRVDIMRACWKLGKTRLTLGCP